MPNFAIKSASLALLALSLVFASVRSAEAATMSVTPADGASSFSVGQLFSVTVNASTASGESLNAVSGTLTYPQALLQPVSVDTSGSIVNFWITQPDISTSGQVMFEGGVYNPGFSGNQGKIVTILFKAKATGKANLGFASASILANDGQGTNILDHTNPASVQIASAAAVAPVISTPGIAIRSSTHPEQDHWYSSNAVVVDWENPSGTTAVRTSFDQDPTALPTKVIMPPVEEVSTTLEDGTWYFHLQTKDSKSWGQVSTFRINIDSAAVDVPVFDKFPLALSVGDVLLVSGSAPKNTQVHMTLSGSNGQISEQSAKADSNGRFQAVWTDKLQEGSYNLSAVAMNQHGITSERTSYIPITVQPSTLVRVARPAVNYGLIVIILAGILLFCVMWIWYLIEHFKHFRKSVRTKLKKANQQIHLEFKKLLDKANNKRKLTVEEEKILSMIKDAIHETEEAVERDVRSAE